MLKRLFSCCAEKASLYLYPEPMYSRGILPYSIIIPASQFTYLNLLDPGHLSLFFILKKQYPKGVIINKHEVPVEYIVFLLRK